MGIDDVATFERRLRRSAAAELGEPTDTELGDVLRHVAARRHARSVLPDAPPGGPDPEPAPTRGAPETAGLAAPGEVLFVQDLTPTLRILRVGRPRGFEFRAGQYVKMGLTGVRLASFSIASAPHEPFLEFCIERIAGGRLTPALFALAVGDRVDLGERAKGRLRLHPAARHHLLVGTVTGIAPLRSLVRDALQRRVPGAITVLHGASHHDELPYRDEFERLASESLLEYVPTVSRADEGRNATWTGATGRVDPLAVSVAGRLDAAVTHVVATGNSAMVANVRSALGARGFDVLTETFD